MASLVDFYKQKLAPKLTGLINSIDRDKNMAGVQLAQGGLMNQLASRGIIGVGGSPSLAPIQVRPAQQFVSGALKPVADAVGTFGKLSFDAIARQPARNRQMQLDTQKAIDASNRALQTAKLTREAGRPDLAAQMTRSMIPQLQAESQRFTDIGKEAQAKQKALIGSGVRTGLYASALAAPVASLGAGALSTGLNAAFAGQTSPEQLGTSFGEGVKYGGMPNPVIKGGLLAKSAVGGLVNLAEDAFYAKTVENRSLTPKEVAMSLALPAAFETGGKLLSKIKASPKEIVAQVDPSGLMYNKAGKLFDPISGKWAKDTMEARLAAQHTKDFIAAGGKPVKAGTRLVEMSDGKWVDEQELSNYASTIDTPNLKVESTDPLLQEAKVPENIQKLKDMEQSGQLISPKSYAKLRQWESNQSKGVEIPKTVKVWNKSKFSNDGAYTDLPVIRKEENITLYQGGKHGDGRQFWTPDKKYASQFGDVKEKTGTFYKVDNGNRVTDVYVDANQSKGVGTIKGVTTKAETPLLSKQMETQPALVRFSPISVKPTTPQPVPQTIRTVHKITKLDQPSESIISEARKQIGTAPEPKDKSIKEVLDDTYSGWVDRYNPLTKASQKAQGELTKVGAVLRPENDPTYLVRRLTGAGGIADARFRTELNPILKEMETLNIPKSDMDVYLANKRMAGFGKAGRDIYGTDPVKAGQVVSALEAKYPQISGVADKMYAYQDKGLNEITQAGFLSPEAVANLKSQNPDYAPLYRVMDEMDTYLGLPTRKTMQGTSPISKIKGSTRQIESPVESIIGNTFRQRAAIEKNRVAQSVVDLQNITDMGFSKVSQSAPDTITAWKNGQKEYWKVGQEIADTAKGVNEESMNLLLKVLQAPASLLRQGATGRNPEFLLPNIIRDQLDAGVTSKYGYIPFVDYVSGLVSMAKNDDVYQKWANSGAKIDLGEISGKKSIQKLFDSKVEKKKLSTWLTQGLDVLGTLSEQPTRVGLFKKAYQKTGNELLAMMESRDATVDFARMGSKMKVANSIIPFLNVGVQGFDKLMRAIKDNPGKVAFNAGVYGVLPALMTTLYNLNNDPEAYNEIPQYEKDSNFVLVTGRNDDGTVDYLTFPKGNVIPSIANPIESFLAFTKNEDPEAFKRMLISTLTSTLPVIGDGSTAGEVATKTIGGLIPQGIKPIAENLLNKSFYKYDTSKEQTKDIVPSYLQNKPDYQQTYEFTPQMYQKIGAVFDASPLKVKNLMEGYLAGFTKIPSQLYEMAYKASRGEKISPNDKTLMRRFIKQTYPSSGKAPQVKPESPSLMERVTGKAGAAETSTKKVIPEWQIDNAKTELKSSDKTSKKISDNLYLVKQTNGDVNRLDLSNVTKMPSTTNYEQVKKESEKWKVADDILKLDPTDQLEAFKTLGISKDDATYYTVAKDTVEAKAAYIKDQVQGVKTYDEFLTKIAPLRKEINGEKILSDGVIDWMYNSDIITSSQKKQLKSLEYDNARKVVKASAKKGTVKKITVKKLGKFNLASKVKKVKRIRTKQYRLKI